MNFALSVLSRMSGTGGDTEPRGGISNHRKSRNPSPGRAEGSMDGGRRTSAAPTIQPAECLVTPKLRIRRAEGWWAPTSGFVPCVGSGTTGAMGETGIQGASVLVLE